MKYALAVMFALLLGVPALATEDYGCGGGVFGRGGGGCGPGGCPSYGPPVYAYPPQRIVYEQPVHHVLLNHGAVQSKFYTKIRFPEGYTTTIPVINGRLPMISVTRSGGQVVRLDLDYQYNYQYGSYGSNGGVVQYENFTGTRATTGTHGTMKAPAPRNPNFEQRGAEAPKKVDAPRADAPTRAPTPRNPNFEQRGSVEAPAVEKPAPAPTPRRPSDEEIDNLFRDMNTTYGGEQDSLRRPSEIKHQESGKSLSFPRYDR